MPDALDGASGHVATRLAKAVGMASRDAFDGEAFLGRLEELFGRGPKPQKG